MSIEDQATNGKGDAKQQPGEGARKRISNKTSDPRGTGKRLIKKDGSTNIRITNQAKTALVKDIFTTVVDGYWR